MPISFTARVSASPELVVSNVGGELVFLNLDNEGYFGLDETGARFWEALTGADSVQSAYDTLLGEFEVEPEQLRRDIEQLIDQLCEAGLLKVVSEAP